MSFTENKGQVLDTEGKTRPDIQYTTEINGVKLYFRDNAVSYVFPKVEDKGKGQPVLSELYRMDLEFVGANPNAQIISEEAVNGLSNFYLGHCPNGIVGVKSYTKLTYKNIYNNIDLVFYGARGGAAMKYDFVVRPGGNPSDIRLRYVAAEKTGLQKDGSLSIVNPIGSLVENAPYVYVAGKDAQTEVSAAYQLENGVVSFQIGDYDANQTLVIDPLTLVASTYYGGPSLDRAYGVAFNTDNSAAVTGYTQNSNFPITPGAYQGSFGGLNDAFVIYFDGSGQRTWATFYGGSQLDQANDIVVSNNNIYFTGYTSSSNFATTGGQNAAGGGDVFVVSLSSTGVRNWALLFGGSSNDQGTSIAADAAGNVIIGGTTFSTNLPVTGNAFQSTFGGVRDWLLLKLTSAGNISWATYFGGSGDDQCFGVDTDANNNIIGAGLSQSANFPVTSGAYAGQNDVALAQFNASGSRNWSTLWGGSGNEQANGVVVDNTNSIVITGQTNSTTGIATSGAFQTTFQGGQRDAFVAKLSNGGTPQWATYLGGSNDDEALRVTVDAANNIFLTGVTLSSNFPVQSPIAQSGATTNGNNDVFVSEFSATGTRRSSSYFGGAQNDVGRGIAARGNRIAVVGQTSSLNFPTQSPTVQPNRAGNDDAFISWFQSDGVVCNLEVTGVVDNVRCDLPNSGAIRIQVSGGSGNYDYAWTGPNGFTATTQNLSGLAAGRYTLKVTDRSAPSCTTDASFDVLPAANLIVSITSNPGPPCTASVSVQGGTPPYTYLWAAPAGRTVTPTTGQNVTVGGSGTYSVTVRDAGGCTGNGFATINCGAAACPIFTGVKTDIACFGLTDGKIEVVTEQLAVLDVAEYSLDGGPYVRNNIFIGLGKGPHNVRARVVGKPECDFRYDFDIIEPPLLEIVSIVPTNVSCNGAGDGRLTVTVRGGTPGTNVNKPGYSYFNNEVLVGQGNSPFTITGLAPGTAYRVRIVDVNNCPAVSARDYTLTQPTILEGRVASQTNVLCFGVNTGSINVVAEGGTPPYSYALAPFRGVTGTPQSTGSFQGLPAGSHRVVIRDANNCVSNVDFTITQPFSSLVVGVAFQRDETCPGSCNGSITATASGGTTPYRYELRRSNGEVVSVFQTSPNFTELCRGEYTLVVRDANDCEASVNTAIFSSPEIVVNAISITPVTCFGQPIGAIDIDVRGGIPPYTYEWSNGATNQDVSGLPAGRHCVTVTDVLGCKKEFCFNVPTETGIIVDANITNVRCFGEANGRIELVVTGGQSPYTYLWRNNGVRTPILTGLPAGDYTVTVTDRLGCSVTTPFPVEQPARLVAEGPFVTNVSCNNGNDGTASVDVTGGVMPYTYRWSNGGTTRVVTGLRAANYNVTVTDANGCLAGPVAQRVDEPMPINGSVLAQPLSCFESGDGMVMVRNVNGGTPPYAYSIDGVGFNNTTGTFTGLASGDYIVTVLDNNGCTWTRPINVPQPPQIIGTVTFKANIACFGLTDGKIAIAASQGTGNGFRYSLNNPNGPFTSIATYDGLSKGVNTIYVQDLGNNCLIAVRENIEEPARLEISSATIANISCEGLATASISVIAGGGTTRNAVDEFVPYQFRINGGAYGRANVFQNLAPGTYTITVRDHNLCTAETTLTVARGLNTSATVTNASCFGGNDGQIVIMAMGGRGGYTYSFEGSQFTPNNIFSNLRAGNYRVRAMDGAGCMAETTITVGQRPSIQPTTVATPPTICEGGTILLSVSNNLGGGANLRYQWLNVNGTPIAGATNATYSVMQSGTFWADVTNLATGCTERSTPTTVTVFPDPRPVIVTATPGDPITVCKGDSVILRANTAVPGSIYNWFKDGRFVQGGIAPVYSAYETGVYTVTVVTDRGCTSTSPGFTVIVNQRPEANIYTPAKTVICINDVITLQASRDVNWSYQWMRNGSPIANTNDYRYDARIAGSYSILITNQLTGCSMMSAPVILTENRLAFTTTPVQPSICGASDGRFIINATGNIGSTAYSLNNGSWMDFNTTATLANLRSGNYSITVRDAQCSVSQQPRLDVAAPRIASVIGVTENTIDVAWTAIAGARYDVEYRVVGAETWTRVANVANNVAAFPGAPIPSIRLTNLQHQSRYEIRVRSLCQGGFVSAWSASERVTTLRQTTGQCFAPANVFVNLDPADREAAFVYWTIPVGGQLNPVCYEIEYRVKGTMEWFSLRVDANEIPFRLRGLLTSTTYELRMRTNCVNCPGGEGSRISNYSPIIEFMTPNFCPELGTLTLNNGSAREVVCGELELAVDNLVDQANLSYQWLYSEDGDTFRVVTPAWGINVGATYVVRRSGYYAVSVRLGNCDPVTSSPIEVVVNAVPQVIANVQSNVSCHMGNNGAILAGCTGENNVCLDRNGNADYEFSIDGMNFKRDGLFTGLTAGQYTMYVRKISTGCQSSFTHPAFTTITQPGVPELSLEWAGTGNIAATWLPIQGAAGYRIAYRILGSTENDWQYTSVDEPYSPNNTQAMTRFIENLQRNGSVYEVRIQVRCGLDNSLGVWSASKTVIVDPQDPNMGCLTPGGFFLSNITFNAARLNWQPTRNAVSYIVQYREFGSPQFATIAPVNGTSYTLTGLNPGVQYFVRIAARCSNVSTDVSTYTEAIAFATSLVRENLATETRNAELSVYPNPNKGQFVASYTTFNAGEVALELMDMKGSVVWNNKVQVVEGTNEIPVEAGLANGVYSLRLVQGTETKVIRVIVN